MLLFHTASIAAIGKPTFGVPGIDGGVLIVGMISITALVDALAAGMLAPTLLNAVTESLISRPTSADIRRYVEDMAPAIGVPFRNH